MNTLDRNMQTNTFTGGMNMDLDPNFIPSDKYIYAENIRIITNDDGSTGVISNSDGVEDLFQIDFAEFPISGTSQENVDYSLIYGSQEKIIHKDSIRHYGIIFTEITPSAPFNEYYKNFNRIYRIDFTKDPSTEPELFFKLIAQGEYNIQTPVSSTTIWESEKNIKIYWADGTHQIRFINIVPEIAFAETRGENFYLNSGSSSDLDILPSFPSNKIIPIGLVKGGELKCGVYQYMYTLMTPGESLTTASIPSDKISLHKDAYNYFDSSNDAYKSNHVEGGSDDESSNTGIRIKVDIQREFLDKYTYIRIYRIYYPSRDGKPKVRLVEERPIGKYGDAEYKTIEYLDLTNSVFSDEDPGDLYDTDSNFRLSFSPRFLEQKDNILFAASIRDLSSSDTLLGVSDNGEISSDTGEKIDFRAYQLNHKGFVKLRNSSAGEQPETYDGFNQDSTEHKYISEIPRESDCFVDFDNNTTHEYISSADPDGSRNDNFFGYRHYVEDGEHKICLGGTGTIISYEFITKRVIIDGNDGTKRGLVDDDNFTIFNSDKLTPNNEFGDGEIFGLYKTDYVNRNVNLPENNLAEYRGVPMDSNGSNPEYKFTTGYESELNNGRGYINPFISSCYKSLRRDEIYRYGIVFRGSGGTKTNVFWIGDIKTPHASVMPYFENINNDNKAVLAANVLGIRFIVDEPKLYSAIGPRIGLINSYEIVMAKRGRTEGTIIASGFIQSLFRNAGVNNRNIPGKNFYQPTWFTSSNGRTDTFSPQKAIRIRTQNGRDQHNTDFSVNHCYDYTKLESGNDDLHIELQSKLANSNLSMFGFVSPEIEFAPEIRQFNLSILGGGEKSNDVIVGRALAASEDGYDINSLYFRGVLSSSSAVNPTHGENIWVNKDRFKFYGVGKDGLSLSTQNNTFIAKSMACLNKTEFLYGYDSNYNYYNPERPGYLFHEFGDSMWTSQLTSGSAGYVSSDGTVWSRYTPTNLEDGWRFGRTDVSAWDNEYLSGYVNSGCSEGSFGLWFEEGGLLHGYNTAIIADSFFPGALSGGHPLLSRYYYQTGVVSTTEPINKQRGVASNIYAPGDIVIDIDKTKYYGVEKTSKGKWDLENIDSSSFSAMDTGYYCRNASILNYSVGMNMYFYDTAGDIIRTDNRQSETSFPSLAFTGANVNGHDPYAVNEKYRRERVRSCPSHGGMLYVKAKEGFFTDKMIIGCGAVNKYNFTSRSNRIADSEYDSTMILITNLKKPAISAYGGLTKSIRDLYTTYYSFGDTIHRISQYGERSIPLFYGDTFIGIFDYTSNYITKEVDGSDGTFHSGLYGKMVSMGIPRDSEDHEEDAVLLGAFGKTASLFTTESISVQHQAYIPIESSINLSLTSNFDPHKKVKSFDTSERGMVDCVVFNKDSYINALDFDGGCVNDTFNEEIHELGWNNKRYGTGIFRFSENAPGITNHHFWDTYDRIQCGYGFVGDTSSQYVYHNMYSSDSTYCSSKAAISATTEESVNSGLYDCRIRYSLQKTNNEIDDSYAKFLADDKIDVDSRYGPITGLLKFKNKLIFWQDTALGYIPVYERSFIQPSGDNADGTEAQILIGTGTVLRTFDYYTTENGIRSRVKNVDGDYKYASGCYAMSNEAIYFYDHSKKEVVIFSGGTQSLSKAKGIQSFINRYGDNFNSRLSFDYDNKYNEALLTFRDIDDDLQKLTNNNSLVFSAEEYLYRVPMKSVSILIDPIESLINDSFEDFYVSDSSDWIAIDTLSNEEDSRVDITVEDNPLPVDRSGFIELTQNRTNNVLKIEIIQDAREIVSSIFGTPNTFSLVQNDETVHSSIVTSTYDGEDVGWTATTTHSFISIINNSGIGGDNVTFNLTPNISTQTRTGVIILTNSVSGEISYITVTQDGLPPIEPEFWTLSTQYAVEYIEEIDSYRNIYSIGCMYNGEYKQIPERYIQSDLGEVGVRIYFKVTDDSNGATYIAAMKKSLPNNTSYSNFIAFDIPRNGRTFEQIYGYTSGDGNFIFGDVKSPVIDITGFGTFYTGSSAPYLNSENLTVWEGSKSLYVDGKEVILGWADVRKTYGFLDYTHTSNVTLL